jgi:hypothetical protein
LGGWLTLLIIVTGPLQVQTFKTAGDLEHIWQPHFGEFPNLQGSVVAEQAALGAGAVLWMATAWILYKRERGSIGKIRKLFVSGGVLSIISLLFIPLLGGLPPETSAAIIQSSVPFFVVGAFVISCWYMYLLRSTRVRELYGESA